MFVKWLRDFEQSGVDGHTGITHVSAAFKAGERTSVLYIKSAKRAGTSNILISEDRWLFHVPDEMFVLIA